VQPVTQLITEEVLIDISVLTMFAVLVAMAARRFGVGTAIPLVVAGVLVGLFPDGPVLALHPETVLVVILAPLVFGEALGLGYVDFKAAQRPILILAIGLVVVGAFAIGWVASLIIPGIPFAAAVAFGAILGPTDAVSVSATAKRAGLSHRLVTILEGESLVNDGAALTFLRVAVLATSLGSVTAGQVGVILTEAVVFGVVVGLVGGFLLVLVIRKSKDLLAVNGLILIAPFPLYLGAEWIEGSGILAVVVAAIVVAHQHTKHGGFRSRLHFDTIWSQITYVLQAAAFVFIGLEIPNTLRLLPHEQLIWVLVLIPTIWLTMVVVRFAFLFIYALVIRLLPATGKLSRREWLVAAWAGARGPISGLAAFSLPLTLDDGEAFPFRNLLIAATLCVVFLTLLLGPTLAPLARALRVTGDADQRARAELEAALARVSLDALEEMVSESDWDRTAEAERAVDILTQSALRRIDRAMEALEPGAVSEVDEAHPHTVKESGDALRRRMLQAEEAEVLRMRDEGGLTDSLTQEVLGDIDLRRRALEG